MPNWSRISTTQERGRAPQGSVELGQALRSAVAACDAALVRELLPGQASSTHAKLLSGRDTCGQTLLHLCVESLVPGTSRLEVLRLLLKAGLPGLDVQNALGESPLLLAVRARLLEPRALAAEDLANRTLAADEGLQAIRVLLEARASPDAPDAVARETPLMEAACAGDVAVCRLLLDLHADPTQASTQGLTAADFARHSPATDMLFRWWSARKSIPRRVFEAAEKLEPALLASAMAIVPPDCRKDAVGYRDGEGRTVLHAAARALQQPAAAGPAAKLIRELTAFAADVNACDARGETPLVTAARAAAGASTFAWPAGTEGSRLIVVRELLSASASANATTSGASGETLLMLAARRADTSLCRLLLDNGADPLLVDTHGLSAADCVPIGDAQTASLFRRESGAAVQEGAPRSGMTNGATVDKSKAFAAFSKFQARVPGAPSQPPPAASPSERSAPSREAATSPLEQMRLRCARVGLCAEWCADEQQLASLLQQLQEWDHFGVFALKGECQAYGIPIEGLYERGDFLLRLRTVMVWKSLSLKQLKDECLRRSIQQFDALEYGTKAERESARKMLLGRLVADAYGAGAPKGPPRGPPESHTTWPPWTGKAVAAPPPGQAAGAASKKDAVVSDEEASSDSEDARRRGEPPSWRKCGPRLKQLLREEFVGFEGELPGSDAEATWTDQELRTYFYSGGEIRPSRRVPPPRSSRPSARPAARPSTSAALEGHCRTLGLRLEDATPDAVRKAYRRLALQFHPDKRPEESDAERFRQIKEAYDAICRDLKI